MRNQIGVFSRIKQNRINTSDTPKQSIFERLLAIAGNGFTLLITGTIISTLLVPRFQHQQETLTKEAELQKDCYTHFLLYSNSIWEEYYAILPLTLQTRLDQTEYIEQIKTQAAIKIKRYDAYAKALSLAISFRDKGQQSLSDVEIALAKYAIEVNDVSDNIDSWLRGMYCTPVVGKDSECVHYNSGFDSFAELQKIKEKVVAVGNARTDEVAVQVVAAMRIQ